MTQIPTYHLGPRNFGTGYDMMDTIAALEAQIATLTAWTPPYPPHGTECLGKVGIVWMQIVHDDEGWVDCYECRPVTPTAFAPLPEGKT
jgi:hypothetical protein